MSRTSAPVTSDRRICLTVQRHPTRRLCLSLLLPRRTMTPSLCRLSVQSALETGMGEGLQSLVRNRKDYEQLHQTMGYLNQHCVNPMRNETRSKWSYKMAPHSQSYPHHHLPQAPATVVPLTQVDQDSEEFLALYLLPLRG